MVVCRCCISLSDNVLPLSRLRSCKAGVHTPSCRHLVGVNGGVELVCIGSVKVTILHGFLHHCPAGCQPDRRGEMSAHGRTRMQARRSYKLASTYAENLDAITSGTHARGHISHPTSPNVLLQGLTPEVGITATGDLLHLSFNTYADKL